MPTRKPAWNRWSAVSVAGDDATHHAEKSVNLKTPGGSTRFTTVYGLRAVSGDDLRDSRSRSSPRLRCNFSNITGKTSRRFTTRLLAHCSSLKRDKPRRYKEHLVTPNLRPRRIKESTLRCPSACIQTRTNNKWRRTVGL